MRYRFLLFDLDGTLVDSLRDLTVAVNAARARVGLAGLSEETVRTFVGDGLAVLLARSVPADEIAAARESFLAHYAIHLLDHTRPYAGVPEMLAAVTGAGCRAAVVTNKPLPFAQRILEGTELARYFPVVVSGEGPAGRKPAPQPFQTALAGLGGSREAALVIGDGPADVQGARAAGLPVCGVLYGLGRPEEMRRLKPAYLISAPEELFPLLSSSVPGAEARRAGRPSLRSPPLNTGG